MIINRKPGFITFEGIDGAGKSTHMKKLAQRLREAGHVVRVTREPGGTPLAERLRELLLHESMDVLTEALLLFAARRDHLCRLIEPALAAGELVLCDRFTDATFAYQGYGRGVDLAILDTLAGWVQSTPVGTREPDLTLWFDLPPETAAQRLAHARTPDRFEAESQRFFARVAAGYARRAQQYPERFVRIDATQDIDDVWSQIEAACQQRRWL